MNVLYSPAALERLTMLWDAADEDARAAIRASVRALETELLRQPAAGEPVSAAVLRLSHRPVEAFYEVKGDAIRILDLRAAPDVPENGHSGGEPDPAVHRPDPEPLLWYPTELAIQIAAREGNPDEPPLPTDAELREDLAGPRFTIDEVLAGYEAYECG